MISIFAHRGHHQEHPENSAAAVASARQVGADGVEVDVWLTQDKHLVVNHDRHILGLDLTRSTRAEIHDVRPVASLDDVLEAAGSARINVEIKATRSRTYNDAVARHVAQHLDAAAESAQCLVSSFSLAVCDEVRRISPQRRVGWLVMDRRADHVLDQVVTHRLNSAHFPFARVTEDVARRARDIGIELHVWTPTLTGDLQRMIDLEVAALITDDVPLAVELRDRRVGATGQ